MAGSVFCGLVVSAGLFGALSLGACADTYCQGGSRYGTQCYSAAQVRPGSAGVEPVAPAPIYQAQGRTLLGIGAPPAKPAPPPENPFVPKPRPSELGAAPPDAGSEGDAGRGATR